MTKKNKVYQLALFGNPVSHSLSPQIHQLFAKQFDIQINYQLIKVTNEEFLRAVMDFFNSSGTGANVTLPLKEEALTIPNNISNIANKAQAINTFYLTGKNEISGDNTDGIGFINDLSHRCHFDCKDRRILILGAGGATKGIVPEIMLQNPKELIIANRSIEKAKNIAQRNNAQALTLIELEHLETKFDLVVHASSLGYQGESLKFRKQQIHASSICYDLSYGQIAQPFLHLARSLGIKHNYDGIGMLIEQAAVSFQRWFNKKPNTAGIIKRLKLKP